MKNTQARGVAFFSMLFNATLFLLFAIFAVSYIKTTPRINANLKIIHFNSRNEYKMLIFEPGIDLTSQFTFNTKQIFMYLTCKSGGKEEMVWSRIVKNKDNYNLYGKEKSNYIFSGVPGTECVFELRGNVFPYVGQLKNISYGEVRAGVIQN